ncbi:MULTISPECIES: ComEA family DNA-binding protein [unclassified Hahella]|uniref:ComEA family DNA-binding protein n=1 Tax=unclassified Hahella TaxID=2624107 RepID=UPI000FDF4DFF|nr:MULTISPECIES: helix-hairpin-helix domain-containing protein [unclassified Hahella]AZZ91653.1 DNA-binding protein [Hahella sp. KA22]MBU6950763.1 helix-hairpin-helix domain-containing protein [Hahella sp. HN01]QAY55023.1 DNA-binding protein [Hahella sp. KA22]
MQKLLSVIFFAFTLAFANVSFATDVAPQQTQPAAQQNVVNINTADAEALAKALNGVGLKKAEAIIEFRTTNGPFKDISELALVKGIGEKTVEKNRSLIVLE